MTTDGHELRESPNGPVGPFGARDPRTSQPDVFRGDEGLGSRRRASRRRLTVGLVLWDALVPAALLSITALFSGAFGTEINGGPATSTDLIAVLLAIAAPLCLGAAGAYNARRRRAGGRLEFACRLLVISVVLSWGAIIVSAGLGWPVDFEQMFTLALLVPVGWMVGRAACDRHPSARGDRVLLVGSGHAADAITAATSRQRQRHLEVVGRADGADHESDDGIPTLGGLHDVPHLLRRHEIDRVIVAFTPERDVELLEDLRRCVAEGVQVDVVPRFFDLMGPNPRAHALGRMALVEVPGRGLSVGQRLAKRTFDLLGAAALTVLLAPLLIVGALSVLLIDGRPVFFRQLRAGRNGTSFRMLKFRTMRPGSELASLGTVGDERAGALIDGHKMRSNASVTRVGRVLRTTSMDELPQLWNVLRGDMSLVGPRPLPPYESEHLHGWQWARHELRPGLTGLWQVSGRSEIDWDERMHLDYAYVSHWSFGSDIRILLQTLPAVLRREGAV
jgi:exopolysaccharide biosynthesis polyprenyl glycosylphosphotransferase